MSQYPPPYDPLSYATPPMAAPSPRPMAVSALAITGIVLGSIGVLCSGCTTLGGLFNLAMGGANPFMPNAPRMQLDLSMRAFGFVAGLLDLGLSIVLLWGSISALSLKMTAYRVLMKWSVVTLVWALVRTTLQLAWVGPASMEAMKKVQMSQPGGAQAAQMMSSLAGPMAVVVAILSFAFVAALPVCFLLFWRSSQVRGAFERGMSGVSMQPPMQYPQQGLGGPDPQ